MTDRWFPLDVQQVVNSDGYTITLTTDVAAHLFLFYTFKEPWTHRVSVNERGLLVPWWAYWCYVSWIIVEQDEPGDTLEHTFQITGLVTCNHIWFRFHGTIAGNSSPSASPIFHKHFVKPELPCSTDWPPKDPWKENPSCRWHGQCYEYCQDGKPTTIEVWLIGNKVPDNDVVFYLEDAYWHPTAFYWTPYVDQTGHILDEVTVPKGNFVPYDATPYSMVIPFANPPSMAEGEAVALTMRLTYPSSPGLWPLQNQVLPDNKFRACRHTTTGTYRPWVYNVPLNIPWASSVTFTP